jgi:hypothetical protein
VKSTQRLEIHRLCEALLERRLIEPASLLHVQQQCQSSGTLLTELIVRENMVSDWELCRVTCEVFGLPFLPVEVCSPSERAREGLDPDYLRHYGLVPLDRFGELLTVAMPCMVSSEVLDGLVMREGGRVLPVVGSVLGNRAWLDQNLGSGLAELDAIEMALPFADEASDWAGIFDAGEEAVQLELEERRRTDDDE